MCETSLLRTAREELDELFAAYERCRFHSGYEKISIKVQTCNGDVEFLADPGGPVEIRVTDNFWSDMLGGWKPFPA